MFCTKCGKKLYDGDSFCAYCGAKVREELMFKTETKAPTRTPRYDEVVFNPPFKAEAERRTQHISEEANLYSSEPKKERISLDWNLEGFPTAERKKDDFEINWDAVIEKKRDTRSINVEKILPETGFKTVEEPVKPVVEPLKVVEVPEEKVEKEVIVEEVPETTDVVDLFAEEKEEPLSIEALERALFGTEDFAALDDNDLGMTVEYKTLKTQKEEQLEAEKFEAKILEEEIFTEENLEEVHEEEKPSKQEFFTFNSKRDAFQELLDKERARLEALENERKTQWEELTASEDVEYVPKKALDFEEVFQEPKTPLVPPLREVAVVLPPLTARVMADDPENIIEPEYVVVLPPLTARVEPLEEEIEACESLVEEVATEEEVSIEDVACEESEECPFHGTEDKGTTEEAISEKTKLRYSDVFPVGTFDIDDDNKSDELDKKEEVKFFFDDEDDDEDDDEKGGNGFIKALIVLLAIIVVLELAAIGVKFLAPESKIALMVDDLMVKVMSLFSEDKGEAVEPTANLQESKLENYVNQLASSPENIGRVIGDSTLKYDLSGEFAFAELAQTSEFQDIAWGTEKDKTNGYYIVEAVLGYYDDWKEEHPDESIVGINQVTVGEVRTGNNGYYVLNRVVYAEEEGDVLEKTETVYLEASEDKIIVKEVKEEIA